MLQKSAPSTIEGKRVPEFLRDAMKRHDDAVTEGNRLTFGYIICRDPARAKRLKDASRAATQYSIDLARQVLKLNRYWHDLLTDMSEPCSCAIEVTGKVCCSCRAAMLLADPNYQPSIDELEYLDGAVL